MKNEIINKVIEKLKQENTDFNEIYKENHILKAPKHQVVIKYPNDYGVSIIYHAGSYGNKEGLVELGVLNFRKVSNEDDLNIGGDLGDSELVYDTGVTDDVIGYCSYDDVLKHLDEIESLKRGE